VKDQNHAVKGTEKKATPFQNISTSVVLTIKWRTFYFITRCDSYRIKTVFHELNTVFVTNSCK